MWQRLSHQPQCSRYKHMKEQASPPQSSSHLQSGGAHSTVVVEGVKAGDRLCAATQLQPLSGSVHLYILAVWLLLPFCVQIQHYSPSEWLCATCLCFELWKGRMVWDEVVKSRNKYTHTHTITQTQALSRAHVPAHSLVISLQTAACVVNTSVCVMRFYGPPKKRLSVITYFD